jgi:hypothetical protein
LRLADIDAKDISLYCSASVTSWLLINEGSESLWQLPKKEAFALFKPAAPETAAPKETRKTTSAITHLAKTDWHQN